MRVAALTDHWFTPSSRFRIRNHLHDLAQYGIDVYDFPRQFSTQTSGLLFPRRTIRNFPPKAAVAFAAESLNLLTTLPKVLATNFYDLTWISRQIINGYFSFERLLHKPFVYDIDDAVYLRSFSSIGVKYLIRNAVAVTAGNRYLAEYCSLLNPNVYIVPTAVDVDRFRPSATTSPSEFTVFGWSGTSSSYKYFLPLESILSHFFRDNPSAKLRFFSDRYPHELKLLHPFLEYEAWSPQMEAAQIRSLDVGLMPLDSSEWSKGKCAYKMLLYAASGIPTVSSNHGMNSDLIHDHGIGLAASSPDNWLDCLEYLHHNKSHLRTLFPNCRETVVNHYSRGVVQSKLVNIFRSVHS